MRFNLLKMINKNNDANLRSHGRPSSFSQRQEPTNKLILSERWKRAEIPFTDIYKILLVCVSFFLLLSLVLFAFGLRYKTSQTPEGVKINFFGFVRKGSPSSGKLHFSDSTKAKISSKNGTVIYSNGTVFKGKLKDLMPHGEGTLTNSLGTYSGTFNKGLLVGIGEYNLLNGTSYSGDFFDGVPHGNGRIIYADGSNYTGQFENGEIHGFGLFIYINGDYYEGEFYKGMRHGNGVYHWATGDSFKGEFAYSNVTENGRYANE